MEKKKSPIQKKDEKMQKKVRHVPTSRASFYHKKQRSMKSHENSPVTINKSFSTF